MTKWIVLSFVAFLTPVIARGQSDAPLIDNESLQQLGLVRFWEAILPLTPDDRIRDAYLVDEALYVTSERGGLFALKADVGLLRWGAPLTEPSFRIYPPRHLREDGSSGPTIVSTTTEFLILDRYTGQVRQRFVPPFAIGSAAIGFDGMLFAGGSDGRFYSLQLNHPTAPTPPKRWEVLAGGPVSTVPLLYDGNTLLFASQAGKVFACLAEDKTFRWSYRVGGAIQADPAIDDGGVYVASADRSLYKLHRGTGKLIWRSRFPGPLLAAPVAVAQTVYQFCDDNGLTALDAITGKEKWRLSSGKTLAAHSSEGDVVFTADGRLAVLDHESGAVLGDIDASAVRSVVPNAVSDSVFLLGRGSHVSCIRLDKVPYLRRQQVMAAKQNLNHRPGEGRRDADLPPPAKPEPDPSESDPFRSRKDVQP